MLALRAKAANSHHLTRGFGRASIYLLEALLAICYGNSV